MPPPCSFSAFSRRHPSLSVYRSLLSFWLVPVAADSLCWIPLALQATAACARHPSLSVYRSLLSFWLVPVAADSLCWIPLALQTTTACVRIPHLEDGAWWDHL